MNPSSGGPCQGIRNSIPALKKLGVHNEVVSMDDPKADFIGKDAFPIYALGPAHNPWAYAPHLKPWLKENISRFDAIIVHGLWLYPGYAINQALNEIRGSKPKLFVMPHGMLDPYFQNASRRRLKAIRNWLYWEIIERKLIHRAEGILFTCEEELVLARDTFQPYSPAKELNVGYGIPEPPPYTPEMSEQFLERCPQVSGNDYLLFISRIHEKKGVDLLVKAYLRLKKSNEQAAVPLLVIAGPGKETAYGRQLQQTVNENPLLKNAIFFPGMLTGAAKWGAFYGSEAFILPSHQENFGIAVVEALACGKQVLISSQVNICQEIITSRAGFVAEDTVNGTINLFRFWQKLTGEEKRNMGITAKNCYEKKFAIGPHVKRLLDAIN